MPHAHVIWTVQAEEGGFDEICGASRTLQFVDHGLSVVNGQYAFRDLPPGEYTIVAKHDGREHLATVSVPDGPAFVKDIDVAVLPAAEVGASAGSLRGSTAERPHSVIAGR